MNEAVWNHVEAFLAHNFVQGCVNIKEYTDSSWLCEKAFSFSLLQLDYMPFFTHLIKNAMSI